MLLGEQDAKFQEQLASAQAGLEALTGEAAEAAADELALCKRLQTLFAATVVRELPQDGASERQPGSPTPQNLQLSLV